jgi:IS30 family transposase
MGEHYKHLSVEDRNAIHRGYLAGKSLRAIAQGLGRPVSSVSREMARNHQGGTYDAREAAEAYRRRRQARSRKLSLEKPLWDAVVRGLYRGWSPEQIAGRLRHMHPDDSRQRASHETIYLALYALPRGELRKALLAQLRQGHKTRKRRTRGQDRRGSLPNMTPIHARPPEVATREVPGHWEGDFIKGAANRSAVGTLVERKSRYLVLARMRGTDAAAALEGFSAHFKRVPACVRKSLTYDQGKEMAKHETLAKRVRIDVYFADPHSPWQRPSNENMNGLVRQYLPKGMDLSQVSQAALNAIAKRLNNRPRKCLDFETPAEVFQRDILNLQSGVALQT